MDTGTSTIAPAITIDCPMCGMLLSLRVWPDADGIVEPGDPMLDMGVGLHLRVGCEAL